MHHQLPQKAEEFDVWGLSGIQSKISVHLEEIWTPNDFLLVSYLFSLSAFPLRNLANLYHFSVFFPLYKVGFLFCKKIEMGKVI